MLGLPMGKTNNSPKKSFPRSPGHRNGHRSQHDAQHQGLHSRCDADAAPYLQLLRIEGVQGLGGARSEAGTQG
jgi:hypothetical protein